MCLEVERETEYFRWAASQRIRPLCTWELFRRLSAFLS